MGSSDCSVGAGGQKLLALERTLVATPGVTVHRNSAEENLMSDNDECECPTCDGSGYVDNGCYECGGSGMVEEDCDDCGGSGKVEKDNK